MIKNFSYRLPMLAMLLEAGDVTKELLNTLLCLGTFPPRDEHNRAGIESVTTVGASSDALSAKATLVF